MTDLQGIDTRAWRTGYDRQGELALYHACEGPESIWTPVCGVAERTFEEQLTIMREHDCRCALRAERDQLARTNEILSARIHSVRVYAEQLATAYPIASDQHLADIIRGVVLRKLDGGDRDV